MDTIVERNTDSSASILVFGLIALAVIAGLGIYFFRLYPFVPATQQPNFVDIQVSERAPVPVAPASSGN